MSKKEILELKNEMKENNKKIILNEAHMSGLRYQIFILIASKNNWFKFQEMLSNFDAIIKEMNYKELSEYFSDNDAYKKERYIRTVIHCCNNITDFWKSKTNVYMDTFEFVSGDDATLKYFYKCKICGSYIVVDNGSDEYDTPCICNHCNKDTGYVSPHHFIEVNSDEWKAHDDYFEFLNRMETDKWFRNWINIKTYIKTFFPHIKYRIIRLFKRKHHA